MRSGLGPPGGHGVVKLTGLMPVRDRKGQTRWYYRQKGRPLVRLPDLPHDHPDFLAAYASAAHARRKPAPGTIGSLCHATLAAPAFARLKPAYRAAIRRHVDAIREAGGSALARDLRRRHIEADLSALSPAVARMRLKAWRFILRAAPHGLDADPSAGIVPPRMPASDGHVAWTAEDVEKFRNRWPVGTVARARFELIAWTGCRVGDAAVIGPQMVGKDGVLAYRQTKTGGWAYAPWTCPLPDYAAGMESDRQHALAALAPLAGHLTFLATRDGRPRSVKAISNDVSADARLAGVQKSAHGLRKYRATSLAEAGASAHQIGAWTGHESLAEVQHYTRTADRRRAVTGTEQDRNGATQDAESAKR